MIFFRFAEEQVLDVVFNIKNNIARYELEAMLKVPASFTWALSFLKAYR